ncbi:hypothetical protein LEP1GSC133_1267 [Leptospira borgpetersenii serovar Pomona str. 200901868]|uniref:Uncharacterized protein n=1 Tax=Leptospira borgpetersenii serovar Pomona str. 200901868 TaxID=1192866 RepID=M6WHL3_LEPBO|nr:hypothetical protein LEP1GSC133_1267 [Leptospira borgpetersenii serovar Pomona str. 200901868]
MPFRTIFNRVEERNLKAKWSFHKTDFKVDFNFGPNRFIRMVLGHKAVRKSDILESTESRKLVATDRSLNLRHNTLCLTITCISSDSPQWEEGTVRPRVWRKTKTALFPKDCKARWRKDSGDFSLSENHTFCK